MIQYIKRRLFGFACEFVARQGYTVVQIRHVAGTDYLVNQEDGSLIRIGAKERRK